MTDRLQHIQNIPCFGPTNSVTEPTGSVITTCDDIDKLGPFLHIGDPVTFLIQCDTLLVLAVAQVNQIWFASQADLDELAVHLKFLLIQW